MRKPNKASSIRIDIFREGFACYRVSVDQMYLTVRRYEYVNRKWLLLFEKVLFFLLTTILSRDSSFSYLQQQENYINIRKYHSGK